jgi:hypothetical protein
MPVLCDFTVIATGDVRVGFGEHTFENWDTSGRESDGKAVFLLMVRGLEEDIPIEFELNGSAIGQIPLQRNDDRLNWHNHILIADGDKLRSGKNNLVVRNGQTKEIFLRNVVCFFNQKS